MPDKILAFTESVAALTFFNVCVRYLFDTQIPDWFDLSKQLQAIAILWGIAPATYRGTFPFIAADLARLAPPCAFPMISPWLPRTLGG